MSLTLVLALVWLFVSLTLLVTLFKNREKAKQRSAEISVAELAFGAIAWPIAVPVVGLMYLSYRINTKIENRRK